MSTAHELVVRRYYEEMNNGPRLDLASELFSPEHTVHDA